MWYIHFFPSASQNMYPSFPSLGPATSQGWGGSQPSFKNRTGSYGGISKWPVKNKGVPRSSRLKLAPWPVILWQLLFIAVGAKSVPDLRRNTSRPYSHRTDWKDAWKSGAHSGSQTRTSAQYVDLHPSSARQALKLWQVVRLCVILMQYLRASKASWFMSCEQQHGQTYIVMERFISKMYIDFSSVD